MKTILIAVLKALGLRKLILQLMDDAVKPALEKLVARTDTEFDNNAMAALYPLLREEIVKVADRLVSKL